MKTNTFYKKMDNIRKSAINTTANVISAPAQYKAYRAGKQADSDVKILKGAREWEGAPDFGDKGMPTDAFKARSLAQDVKERLAAKAVERNASLVPKMRQGGNKAIRRGLRPRKMR